MGIEIGSLHVRRSGLVRATPERVWQEFASFGRLAARFGRGHSLEAYEPRIGGQVRLRVEIDGSKRRFGGDAGADLEGYEAGWQSRPIEALEAIVEGQSAESGDDR